MTVSMYSWPSFDGLILLMTSIAMWLKGLGGVSKIYIGWFAWATLFFRVQVSHVRT